MGEWFADVVHAWRRLRAIRYRADFERLLVRELRDLAMVPWPDLARVTELR
jgi:hypothetical protein